MIIGTLWVIIKLLNDWFYVILYYLHVKNKKYIPNLPKSQKCTINYRPHKEYMSKIRKTSKL